MTDWIVGPKQDAINAWAAVAPRTGAGTLWSDVGGIRLDPKPTTDGQYALPPQILTDPVYADAAEYVDGWSTVSDPTLVSFPSNFSSFGWRLSVPNGTRLMIHSGHCGSITMPAENVYRFNVKPGDRGATADITNAVAVRRRSTLLNWGTLASPTNSVGLTDPVLFWESGATVWYSTTLVIGDYSNTHNIDQSTFVFGTGTSVSPTTGIGRNGAAEVIFDNEKLTIQSRSSAQLYSSSDNGFPINRYEMTRPAKGVKTNIVMQATFGESGHLNAWINGSQVVNVDAPLGYYSTNTRLAGIEAGLYTWEGPDEDVMYLANLEYGTDSLSARITAPTSVPNLDW